MVGASKILTVSYGTFSCTLEGFDDSFETMKAIAEYFRDLAADDRYFGAEPPVPDAEMLARIAEREIQSRVDARIQDNNVVLRARSGDPTPELGAPARPAAQSPAAQPAAQPPVATPAPFVDEIVDDVAENAPMFPAAEDPDAESVAAKLKRIRAVVSKAKAATQQNVATDDTAENAVEETLAEDILGEEPTPAVNQEAIDKDVADKTDDIVAAETAEADAEEKAEDLSADLASDAAVDEEPEADTLAAERHTEVIPTESMVEDTTEVSSETMGEALAEMDEETTVTEILPETAEDVTEDETAAGSENDIAIEEALAPQLMDEAKPEEEESNVLILDKLVGEETEAAEADETSNEETAISSILGQMDKDADLNAELDAVEDASTEDDISESVTDDEAVLASVADAPAEEEAETVEATAEGSKEKTLTAAQRARARLIKLKKAEFSLLTPKDSSDAQTENAFAGALDDEDDTLLEEEDSLFAEDDADETELMAKIQSDLEEDDALSADDEADLMEELGVSVDDETEERESPTHIRRTLLENEEVDEEAERILDETNQQFDAPEGSRRRSAISHLRAAVAATVAERLLKGGKSDAGNTEEEDDAEPYREDLAKVIRPRRPRRGSSPARLAPLMLVSEQRIDEEPADEAEAATADTPDAEATPVTPIRPRRIRKETLSRKDLHEEKSMDDTLWDEERILADSTSFAEFADRMGATELPDLLEAAAAYASYIEGRPHFSRPQIMRQIAKIEAAEGFNREDSLRSFGQLLRQGKIHKVKRGLFAISETTRFKPESRIAGE